MLLNALDEMDGVRAVGMGVGVEISLNLITQTVFQCRNTLLVHCYDFQDLLSFLCVQSYWCTCVLSLHNTHNVSL